MHMCDSRLALLACVYVRPNYLLIWAVCPVDVLKAGDRDLPAILSNSQESWDCDSGMAVWLWIVDR